MSAPVGAGPILLITATRPEAGDIPEALGAGGGSTPFTPIEGEIDGRRVIWVASGVGVVNAAAAAMLAIERYSPSLIINFGIGGAMPGSGLSPGDVAVAEREVLAEAGIETGEGFLDLSHIDLPLIKHKETGFYGTFPLCNEPLEMLKKLIPALPSGTFLTVSTITGTAERAAELTRRFPAALVENMEGAAIAQLALACSIPLIEIRGISNHVGPREREKWEVKRAAEAARKTVLDFLKAL